MYLEYGFQYLVADLTSQVICVSDKLQTHLEHYCRLAHAFGQELPNVMYVFGLLPPAYFIQHVLIHAQHATNFMFVSVTKHNVMSEQILAVFTILKSGFLRLMHPSFLRFIHYQLNYYEFIHYDRQTVWQILLQHIQTYYQNPKNNSQIMPVAHEKGSRQFLTELMPLLKAFLEPVALTMDPAPAG